MVPPRIARIAALICLTAIAFFRFETGMMQIPFIDRRPLVAYYGQLTGLGWEQYRDFLDGVRAHTAKGDSIAIMVPGRRWNQGYSYAYYRATYMLAGRWVIPLLDGNDRLLMGNLQQATYLAEWQGLPKPGGGVVWSGSGGALVRQR